MTEFTKEKNKELCERYPFLIPRNVWTDKIPENYDYSYINGIGEFPQGWNKLFLQMCEDIRQPLIDANYLDKFRFTQIKEKYNYLRTYNNGAPEEVENILLKYEHVSQFVCQTCGNPATKETEGWIAGFCNQCFNKLSYLRPAKSVSFDPVIRINKYKNGKKQTCEIDCSDIWKRLFHDD